MLPGAVLLMLGAAQIVFATTQFDAGRQFIAGLWVGSGAFTAGFGLFLSAYALTA